MRVILTAVFIPFCIATVFSLSEKFKSRIKDTDNKKSFIIHIPPIVSVIGIICSSMSGIIMLLFSVFSKENPHIVFYIVFGGFLWLGAYLTLKAARWKVIVNNEKMTVYPVFSRPYAFDLKDISVVQRQVKNQQSERLVIHTNNNKRLIVESLATSYLKLVKIIEQNLSPESLHGF